MGSLGVTMFELVTGGLLIYTYEPNIKGWAAFSTYTELTQYFGAELMAGTPVETAEYVEQKTEAGRRAVELLDRLLAVDPEERATLEDALASPWSRRAAVYGRAELLAN